VNRRTRSVQFSTEGVVITVLAMVRFSMRVSSGAHLLEIRLRQRRLVSRQGCMVCGAAAGKDNEGDENRQQY